MVYRHSQSPVGTSPTGRLSAAGSPLDGANLSDQDGQEQHGTHNLQAHRPVVRNELTIGGESVGDPPVGKPHECCNRFGHLTGRARKAAGVRTVVSLSPLCQAAAEQGDDREDNKPHQDQSEFVLGVLGISRCLLGTHRVRRQRSSRVTCARAENQSAIQ